MDYGLCPLCNSKLDSDGEWIGCTNCDGEWHEEDFINKYLNKVYVTKIEQGSKIYCEGEQSAYKLQDELNNINIETRVGCNEAEMWSVYIISVPEEIFQFESKQMINKLKDFKRKGIDNLTIV